MNLGLKPRPHDSRQIGCLSLNHCARGSRGNCIQIPLSDMHFAAHLSFRKFDFLWDSKMAWNGHTRWPSTAKWEDNWKRSCQLPSAAGPSGVVELRAIASAWFFEVLENRFILEMMTPILPYLQGSSCIYYYFKHKNREGDTSQNTAFHHLHQPPPFLFLPWTFSGVAASEWVEEEKLKQVNSGTLATSKNSSYAKVK